MAKKSICIPLASLTEKRYAPEADGGDKDVTPEKGDIVEFRVQGILSKIDGKMAYITPKTINGGKLDNSADDDESEEDGASEKEPSREELMGEMATADGNMA